MQAPKSQKTLLLERAWKKAYKANGPITFSFDTPAGAVRARLALYNAVKKAKNGSDPDFELCEAAQNVEICWTKGSKTSFYMQRIDNSDFIQGMERGLGESLGGQMDTSAEQALVELGLMKPNGDVVQPQKTAPTPVIRPDGSVIDPLTQARIPDWLPIKGR